MMRGTLTILSFVSAVLFPWPFTALLALAASFTEPLVPLAAGLFADTLYYAPQAHVLPLFTLYGALLTALAFFVRDRLKTSIIGK
ncbi:MAG: hypothetical protein Q7R59_00635 [bacterium]|nr:hypothetical protein [bacterium]